MQNKNMKWIKVAIYVTSECRGEEIGDLNIVYGDLVLHIIARMTEFVYKSCLDCIRESLINMHLFKGYFMDKPCDE